MATAPANPQRDPELLKQTTESYARILKEIYDKQTAGDYTFYGVLASFLADVDSDT